MNIQRAIDEEMVINRSPPARMEKIGGVIAREQQIERAVSVEVGRRFDRILTHV